MRLRNQFAQRWVLFVLLAVFIAEGADALSPYITGAATPTIEAVTMPLTDYLRAIVSWELAHGNHSVSTKLNLKIPSLDIYDPDGQLVYHGEDTVKNAELLNRLPAGVDGLKPVSPQQSFTRALDVVSDFQKKSGAITSAKKYTIYSTTATRCANCKTQEQAVEQILSKKSLGMNILRLTLQN